MLTFAMAALVVFDGRYGAVLLGVVLGLRVLALVVTLPAHWEQPYCLPPLSSLGFHVQRHRARLTSKAGLSQGGGILQWWNSCCQI